MTDRWLVEISGLRLGPLERAEVEQMIDSGEVRLDDRVCAEGSDEWQRARVLFVDDIDDDTFLCGPASTELVGSHTEVAARPQVAVAESSVQTPLPELPPPVADVPTPVEAQFYIQRDGDEVGPLTLAAVQEFADDGLLHPDTPVRGEDDAVWTTAEDYGFDFPVADPESEAPPVAAAESAGSRIYGGLLGIVFAPYLLLTSGGREISGLSRRQMAISIAVLACVAYVGFHVVRNWSQTALTGVITLDDEPLADVLIVLTGPSTGESGTGVSNGSGRFRIVTIDGELTPGEYQVTVHPLNGDTVAPTIPERFQVLGRSDVIVDVTESTTSCEIELSSKHRLKRSPRYQGGSSGSATVD